MRRRAGCARGCTGRRGWCDGTARGPGGERATTNTNRSPTMSFGGGERERRQVYTTVLGVYSAYGQGGG